MQNRSIQGCRKYVQENYIGRQIVEPQDIKREKSRKNSRSDVRWVKSS